MKKFSFSILIALAVFISLEILLRLSGSLFHWPEVNLGPDSHNFENKLWQNQLFSGFLGVQEPDPYLLWKFKPNLNRGIFMTNSKTTLGAEYLEKKPAGRFRILLLGDSSPVGLGLAERDQALGERLLRLLREAYPGKDLELINASVSGYTSAQGLAWFKKYGLKLEADLVLIYFGNNDASYNGFLEDRHFFDRAGLVVNLQEVLHKSALYRALKQILLYLKEKTGRSEENQAVPKVRVSPDDYTDNLAKIIELAKNSGAKVILTTVPVPREWPPAIEFKPFVNLVNKQRQLVMGEASRKFLSEDISYCLDWDEIQKKYPRMDFWTNKVLLQVFSDTGDTASAAAFYQEKLKAEPNNPVYNNNLAVLYWREHDYLNSFQYMVQALSQDGLNPIWHYNLGMIVRSLGDSAAAGEEFEKAKELDYYSLRTKNIYNQKLKELAAKFKLPLLDLDSLFLANKNEYLFIDHCHPKPEGHQLIAQALSEKLKETGWISPKKE